MAASILRFRKLCFLEPLKLQPTSDTVQNDKEITPEPRKKKPERRPPPSSSSGKEWRCFDNCCWTIGCLCTTWWLCLFLFNCLPATLPGFHLPPESPGIRLKREGLTPLHPVVMVPGIVTGGLELWEGKSCAKDLFRKRLWGGTFTDVLTRPLCWLEHLSLDNETGLDPPGIRVRAVTGLVAADYFAPGYFVWAVLIENLAKIGYEGKNLHMAAYDWRLSFHNTEIRDQSLSRLKSKIELMYVSNGNNKVVVVPHSMGVLYFLHFLKWVEAPPPMGGGGGPDWCSKHIKAVMNIGPAFLGVPKTVSNFFSAEAKDVALIRAMDPGLLDSEILGLQTLEHVLKVSRTWDSVVSLLPKGGEAIWGNLDWSPEDNYACGDLSSSKRKSLAVVDDQNSTGTSTGDASTFILKEPIKYGRLISFGKDASELPSSLLPSLDPKELMLPQTKNNATLSCKDIKTEYDEMNRENIPKIAENKAYTATTVLDLLRVVAPKTMKRAEAHFSHGIADNLDDPKYAHYKYWSNPLETKLPDAPDMEIYCMYGVGIPTERSYVYKMSPNSRCNSIPFRIDSSVDGGEGESCLRGGVYHVDGDESVPVLSAGFMCAKGWKGRTRFNPSGISTYVREHRHKPPASLLEGRGAESGAHVDIMGN
ncbi:Putative phospholipid:diacylglycerol acyltransferase 2, partial [Linum grandiflorum]